MKKFVSLAIFVGAVAQSHAQVSFAAVFFIQTHDQVAASTLNDTGAFFGALLETEIGDLSAAQLTTPGASPVPMAIVPGFTPNKDSWQAQSALFGSGTDLANAYPFGTYQIDVTANNSNITETSIEIDHSSDHYPVDIPLVTNYDALVDWDLSSNLTVTSNTFTQTADQGLIFWYITNTTTNSLIASNSGNTSATNINLLAGDFVAGNNYQLRLVFSDRKTFTGGPQVVGYDRQTTVNFNPVPEPATMVALSAGLLALAQKRRNSA